MTLQRSLTWLLLATSVVALTACGSRAPSRMTYAAATPLTDLNLLRDEIPEVLLKAQKKPYATPEDQSCGALALQVHMLDEVLGADLDTPATDANPGLVERGTDAAENSAVGALQRTAEGLVPFRSWVRKLSGAERHSKKIGAVIAAGTIRRAFLKGVAAANGCVLRSPTAAEIDADLAAQSAEAAASVVAPASSASTPE